MESLFSSELTSKFWAPVQILILIIVVYIIKRVFFRYEDSENNPEPEPVEVLEPMKKRDFQTHELREFDGRNNQRILIAVNSKVFDVTRGKHFYGPDGPYGVFGGRDASRGLATFSVDGAALKDEYDDLSDLNSMQVDSLKEWEMQFIEKYDYVGRLLKPGEKARNYDQESETEDDESKSSVKKSN